MPKIIVPVGLDLGPEHPADETETFHYEILTGEQSVDLPEDAYRVWALAFPDVESQKNRTFTREKLTALAIDNAGDTDRVKANIDALLESGLLVEYDPDSDEALRFLEQFRLIPCSVGMGNTPERPDMYRLGRGGEVLLEVFSDIFSVWSLGLSTPSIWHATSAVATPDTDGTSATDIGHVVADAVPVLVALELAYLQVS